MVLENKDHIENLKFFVSVVSANMGTHEAERQMNVKTEKKDVHMRP